VRVLKWDVKVDDAPHPIGAGRVLLVGCQDYQNIVQVWTQENRDGQPMRRVQAFGTGQDITDWGTDGEGPRVRGYVGSTIAGPFVWHLFEVT
jgi:uncharacterized short protein YbdD (DUF466 family)